MLGSNVFCTWLIVCALLQLGSVMAQAPAYITVATAAASKNGGAVRSMNATIQVVLDSHTRPELSHGDHLTWKHGRTKVLLQTTWAGTEGMPWRSSYLRVSTKAGKDNCGLEACNDTDVAATSNAYGISDRRLEWELNDGTATRTNGMTTVTHELSPQKIVMDRNNALCVVLATAESQPQLRGMHALAPEVPSATIGMGASLTRPVCAAPPMPTTPDFPESFHTGIEASITEKGYTFHVYESYSAACNSVMFSFHSALAGYVRVLTDYKNGKMWQMFAPNATYPNGVCTSEPLDPKSNLVFFEGNQIASSARFLGFLSSSGAAAEFQPPAAGFPDLVRGVPVEEWVYREAVRNSSDSADVLGRYTVHLYFSTPEWHFGPSSGYRILQRVALKGRETAANGTNPVTHSYDFVDFVPYVPPFITFEPCEMLPGGEGCDCIDLGCTAPSSEGVTFFTEPNGASVSADNTATTRAAAPCIDSHSGTEHDRELLGVWAFGLVLGVVLALLGVFLTNYLRKKRIARQLDQEAAQQQAASSAPQTYAGFAGLSAGEVTPVDQ